MAFDCVFIQFLPPLTSEFRPLVPTHHSNEQVGDAGRADVAHRRKLATIDILKKHHAATDTWRSCISNRAPAKWSGSTITSI
jgi:hypothetical protein